MINKVTGQKHICQVVKLLKIVLGLVLFTHWLMGIWVLKLLTHIMEDQNQTRSLWQLSLLYAKIYNNLDKVLNCFAYGLLTSANYVGNSPKLAFYKHALLHERFKMSKTFAWHKFVYSTAVKLGFSKQKHHLWRKSNPNLKKTKLIHEMNFVLEKSL